MNIRVDEDYGFGAGLKEALDSQQTWFVFDKDKVAHLSVFGNEATISVEGAVIGWVKL